MNIKTYGTMEEIDDKFIISIKAVRQKKKKNKKKKSSKIWQIHFQLQKSFHCLRLPRIKIYKSHCYPTCIRYITLLPPFSMMNEVVILKRLKYMEMIPKQGKHELKPRQGNFIGLVRRSVL